MTDRHHVLVDVTRAQAGEPAVLADVDEGPLDQATALRLGDDLRRAALTVDQLHEEYGDDRDPRRQETARARREPDITPSGHLDGDPI